MLSAVFEAPGKIRLEEVDVPEPKENEVRIRIEGCGICGSNMPVYEGREWFNYPFDPGTPGHEGWGVIDAVGAGVSDFKKGDRVAALSFKAFAEYDIATATSVVKIPTPLLSTPFPGEPLGCVMNIFKRADISSGQTVAIIGLGFLGSLLTSLVKSKGAKVIAISRRATSLNMGEKFNADYIIPVDDHWKIIDKVKEITKGEMCDRVIEAVGKQWPLDLAGELTKTRGKLIIAGFHQDGPRQVNMQLWNWRGIDVINAHERDEAVYVDGIRAAIEAVGKGELNPEPLYTHKFSLKEINEAFKVMQERPEGFMKALIYNN
jgi:threonine dehydrogenase-like Zn-dependent dehydrogenase